MQKPFEAKQPAGLKRLMALLSRTMIRAAKKDLVSIPPLYYKVRKALRIRKMVCQWPNGHSKGHCAF